MKTEIKIIATPQDAGQRLDKFLAQSSDMSRTRIANLINSGDVWCNAEIITDISQKVKADDEYVIKVPELSSLEVQKTNIPLDIVYEDKDIIVINKPAGLVVHPAAGHASDTLVNALLYHCDDLSGIGGVERPGIVHRLDKDTSGLMIVAKNDNAHIKLSEQFANHEIEKIYMAIVYGTFKPLSGTIKGNIGRSPKNRQKMAVVQGSGKPAITHYKTLEVYCDGSISLVECGLETGRTHQIRVHLSQNGHSLIGDTLYGGGNKSLKSYLSKEERDAINGFARQALHAHKLTFIHPASGEELSFTAELPKDMHSLLSALGTNILA